MVLGPGFFGLDFLRIGLIFFEVSHKLKLKYFDLFFQRKNVHSCEMSLKINKQITSTALLLSSSITFTVPPLFLLCCGKTIIYISCFSWDVVFFPMQLVNQKG